MITRLLLLALLAGLALGSVRRSSQQQQCSHEDRGSEPGTGTRCAGSSLLEAAARYDTVGVATRHSAVRHPKPFVPVDDHHLIPNEFAHPVLEDDSYRTEHVQSPPAYVTYHDRQQLHSQVPWQLRYAGPIDRDHGPDRLTGFAPRDNEEFGVDDDREPWKSREKLYETGVTISKLEYYGPQPPKDEHECPEVGPEAAACARYKLGVNPLDDPIKVKYPDQVRQSMPGDPVEPALEEVDTAQCRFPFSYRQMEHYGCTTLDSRTGRAWCVLREDKREGPRQWAYCKNDCLSVQRDCTADSRGNGMFDNKCVFPFRYNGVEYGGCITTAERKDPFCFTEVAEDGTGVPDKWGTCGECQCAKLHDENGRECLPATPFRKFKTYGCVGVNAKRPWCKVKLSEEDAKNASVPIWGFCKHSPNCAVAPSVPKHVQPNVSAVPRVISFGSCYYIFNAGSDPDTFRSVVDHKTDMWLWLGDNMYTDTIDTSKCGKMERDYRALKEDPAYGQVLRAGIPVLGIWDDHDYGWNNAGKEYVGRVESQQHFLNFFDVPADDPRRSRPGVYLSRKFQENGKAVKLIMLDTRSFRDPLVSGYEPPCNNQTADVLGDEQWAWLQHEMQDSADVLIIASGIQVLTTLRQSETKLCFQLNQTLFDEGMKAIRELDEVDAVGSEEEGWGASPAQRLRLLRLVQEGLTKRTFRAAVFLSGDVHSAEVLRMTIPAAPDLHLDAVDVFEVTASGIMQHWQGYYKTQHRLRVAADTAGDGKYVNECDMPFVYKGEIYKNCTTVDSNGKPWCMFKQSPADLVVDERVNWGNCAPVGAAVPWGRQGRVGNPSTWSRSPYKINSVVSNYGQVVLNLEQNEIALRVLTPHEPSGDGDHVAAETYVRLLDKASS